MSVTYSYAELHVATYHHQMQLRLETHELSTSLPADNHPWLLLQQASSASSGKFATHSSHQSLLQLAVIAPTSAVQELRRRDICIKHKQQAV